LLYDREKVQAVFHKLSPIAQDLLAAFLSQAYVERICSALGILPNDKMTRMDKSLEIRTWMKVNAGPLRCISFVNITSDAVTVTKFVN